MSDLEYPDCTQDVEQIINQAADDGYQIEVDSESIDEQIADYTDQRVDSEDATRYVAEDILRDHDISSPQKYFSGTSAETSLSQGNPQASVGEIDEIGWWINLKGVILELYDSSVESIAQQGKITDGDEAIRFTIWESSGIDIEVEVGETYNFQGVVTGEYEGEFEIKTVDSSTVAHITGDDALDIDPDSFTETMHGVVVDFHPPMGLIDRCPECGRVTKTNDAGAAICEEHGEVEPTTDLRTKAVLDNGSEAKTIFLDAEQTAQVTDISLDDAKAEVENGTERERITQAIEGILHGEYIQVNGRDRGQTFNVWGCSLSDGPSINDLEQTKQSITDA